MKHRYIYISAGRQVDETSKAFVIFIGSCRQDQRDFEFLKKYSEMAGHYFEKDSEKVSSFLWKIQKSVQNFPQLQLISARDMVRNIKSCTNSPYSQDAVHANLDYLKRVSLDFRVSIFA